MEEVDKIIDQALAILRKKPVDGYEIYLDQSSHFEVEAKEGKVDTLQVSHSWGLAFRILNHQRMGFSYTTSSSSSLSPIQDVTQGLERIVEDAIAGAAATSSDSCYDFAPVLTNTPPPLPIVDHSLGKVSEKAKIEKAKRLEEETLSVDPSLIKKVRKAAYQEVAHRRTLVNSNDLRLSYDATLVWGSVTAVAEASGASEVGWEFGYSHFFNDLDVERVGRSAGKKALERLGGKRISSGIYPVLLRNHVASEFLSLLAHSFLSEQVHKGKSSLKGKRGQKVFSPLLTFLDDGLLPEGMSTSPVDGEGTLPQRTRLVVEGEVCGYLYDRYWSNRESGLTPKSQVNSTGNSRRAGIKSPPALGISNFFIEPGKTAPHDLPRELHRGLVVDEVMGIHTVDPISGDFSLGCSGEWIERGERVHPVKSIAMAGNLFELFRKVTDVGKDLRFFGGVGSPSLLIDSLEISGN